MNLFNPRKMLGLPEEKERSEYVTQPIDVVNEENIPQETDAFERLIGAKIPTNYVEKSSGDPLKKLIDNTNKDKRYIFPTKKEPRREAIKDKLKVSSSKGNKLDKNDELITGISNLVSGLGRLSKAKSEQYTPPKFQNIDVGNSVDVMSPRAQALMSLLKGER